MSPRKEERRLRLIEIGAAVKGIGPGVRHLGRGDGVGVREAVGMDCVFCRIVAGTADASVVYEAPLFGAAVCGARE